MFLGEFAHTIDEKGRLTIPARFRSLLVTGAVVTRGYDQHLVVYTPESFETLARVARTLSSTDPEHRALARLLFSGAVEVTLDKAYRINIPPNLRTYAGLGNEAMVVGAGDYAEIWNPSGWQGQLASLNDTAANARRFAPLNLAPGA